VPWPQQTVNRATKHIVSVFFAY